MPVFDPAAAVVLRSLLEEGQYNSLHLLIRSNSLDTPFVGPYADGALRHELQSLAPLEAVLLALFTLGDEVALETVTDAFDAEILDDLVRAGVLEQAGGSVWSRFLLVPYLNRYLLASFPPWHPRYDPERDVVYVGPESFWLAKFLVDYGPFTTALDLCTGTGLLASLLNAKQISAVEIDPFVADVARFNLALNGMTHDICVLSGDLYEAVGERRFDLIVANPPFLPAPAGVHLPLCGDGGPTGDDVLKRVLVGLEEHLSPYGQAWVYGEGFGNEFEPFLAGWLRERSVVRAFNACFFLGPTQSVDEIARRLTGLWQGTGASEEAAFAAWNGLHSAADAMCYYSFLLRVAPGNGQVAIREVPRV